MAISVVALLMGAVTVAYPRFHEAMVYRATVRDVLADLYGARNAAQRNGAPVAFRIDLAQRTYGVGDHLNGRIPDALEVRVIVAEHELDNGGRGAIRFHPDGSATGGSITVLRRSSGQGIRLRVDWLLGRISQELPL